MIWNTLVDLRQVEKLLVEVVRERRLYRRYLGKAREGLEGVVRL